MRRRDRAGELDRPFVNVEEGPWDTRWVKVAKKEDPNREREGKEEGEGFSTFEGRRVSGERASFISRRKWIEKSCSE